MPNVATHVARLDLMMDDLRVMTEIPVVLPGDVTEVAVVADPYRT